MMNSEELQSSFFNQLINRQHIALGKFNCFPLSVRGWEQLKEIQCIKNMSIQSIHESPWWRVDILLYSDDGAVAVADDDDGDGDVVAQWQIRCAMKSRCGERVVAQVAPAERQVSDQFRGAREAHGYLLEGSGVVHCTSRCSMVLLVLCSHCSSP